MNLDTPQVLYTGAPDHEPVDADLPVGGTWRVAQCSARTGKVLWMGADYGTGIVGRRRAHDAADHRNRREPSPRIRWRAVLR